MKTNQENESEYRKMNEGKLSKIETQIVTKNILTLQLLSKTKKKIMEMTWKNHQGKIFKK